MRVVRRSLSEATDLCMYSDLCCISCSDYQPVDRVYVHVILLKEFLIDYRVAYGGTPLQTRQIIFILRCFLLQKLHKSTFRKQIWSGSAGKWTTDLGWITGVHYSPSRRQMFFSCEEIFKNFQIFWKKKSIFTTVRVAQNPNMCMKSERNMFLYR